MKIKQFEIWTADLNPKQGTEPGKIRPVVIIQTDLLNDEHPSTIICPLTTNVQEDAELLRIHLKEGQGIKKSDILVDQMRSIDNRRLLKRIGQLTPQQKDRLKQSIRIILDL
ncbi:MAG: type II toxin-antitoxin system PemK/MazF family toxin [Saprospiraceae bacterium]